MTRSGTVIENPITGERVTVLETATDLLRLDLVVRPHGAVAAAHVHPEQEERFTVHAGLMRLRVGDDELLLGPGHTAVVPAGLAHDWSNAAPSHLHATVEFRPALRTASMFEALFGLAAAGRTDAKGLPNLLQTAVLLRAYRREVRLARPPRVIQRLIFGLLAPVARLLGYRAGRPTSLAQSAGDSDSSEGTTDRPEPSLSSESADPCRAPSFTLTPSKAGRSRP